MKIGALFSGRYKVQSLLGKGSLSTVYMALDSESNQRVVLKILEPRFLRKNLESLVRFRRDANILYRLRHENVVRFLDQGDQEGAPYIVTEFLEGETLREWMHKRRQPPKDIPFLLEILCQIVQGLDCAHKKGILHRDIKPANILLAGSPDINEEDTPAGSGYTIKVLDFCVARLIDFSRFLAQQSMADTFCYMSPEQAGLLRQPVDQRADLYSVGILGYELLCGNLPFQSRDPGAVLRQHLVMSPPLPHEVNPLIPESLSGVMEHLIAKLPEGRYFSAEGLLEDLHSVKEAIRKGLTSVSLSKPRATPTDRPKKRISLIERSSELETLKDVFDHAREAKGGLLLIEGEAGIGKTRLIKELREALLEKGCCFLYGKCDEYGSRIPYQPYRMALEEFAGFIREWPEDKKLACKERLHRYVKDRGVLIAQLVPELSEILGPLSNLAELDPIQDRDRLQEAFSQFLGGLGSPETPLVLVLDDLQWAEEETFQLLARHLDPLSGQNCLIACLYRTEEKDRNPHLVRLRELAESYPDRTGILSLPVLSPEGVRAYVREALSISGPGFQMLYKEISQISRGNPFILQEALQALIEKEVLKQRSEDGSWTYEQDALHRSMISSNVIDLILKRIQGVSASTREVLSVSSALRGNFSFENLLPFTGMEEYELLDRLDEGIRMQFIEETPSGGDRIVYQFVHDKIREAIYNQIPEAAKKKIHHRIGEHLQTISEEKEGQVVFDLAHHFLQAGDLPRALPYLIKAGDKACFQNAHREAVHHYEEALKIVEKGDPRFGYLHEQQGDMFNILGEYDRAIESYGMIRSQQLTNLARAAWNRKVGTVLHKKGDTSNAIHHLEEALVQLDRRLYKRRLFTILSILVQTLLQALPFLGKPRAPGKERKGKEENLRIIELTRIYRELTYLYSFSEMFKAMEAHLFHFRFAVRSGEPSLQADAFRFHGIYLAQMRRFRKGRAYLQKSLEIYRQLGDTWGVANTVNYMAVWNLYKGNLQKAMEGLEEGIAGLQKAEDRWELETAYVHLASIYWARAENKKAVGCFEQIEQMATEGGDERGMLSAHAGLGLSWGLLGEERKADDHFQQARRICERSEHPFFLASYLWMFGAYCLMRGQWEESIRALRESTQVISRKRLFSYYVIMPFYVLSSAYMRKALETREEKERRKWLRSARVSLLKGRLLGAGFPLYMGRWWALWGSYCSLKGKGRRARKAFKKGIRVLEKLKVYYSLGQAYEECAGHLARQGDPEAEEYKDRAKALYREKGLPFHYRRVTGQAVQADQRAIEKTPKTSLSIAEEPILTPENRAFNTLLEASRLITSTLDLTEVLERMMDLSVQSLGAERGLLLFDRKYVSRDSLTTPVKLLPDSPLSILATRNMEQELLGSKAFVGSLCIIREVARTRKSLLVRDARTDPWLEEKLGFPEKGLRSVLCLPVTDEDRLVGLLYLDNLQVTHLFSQQDLDFLQSLASFALIAIRNARAFEETRTQRDEIQHLKERLQEEIVYLKEEIQTEHNFEEIVGGSAAIKEVFRFIEKAAPLEQPVLILGETGTGKELVARAVHRLSRRCEGPFIKVNCAALPAGLLESELFGHEKGAFTGAIRRKIGRFELADRGTLFLDEIGEIAPELQAKLLRVLQDMEFERVGGTQTLKVDVRILAATNRNLDEEMQRGTFREDLYYRLNVLPVQIPPLRDRKEDLSLLVSYFIDRLNKQLNKNIQGLDRQSMEMVHRYPWPGNVRELENLIERAMVLSSGPSLKLTSYLFPEKGSQPDTAGSSEEALPVLKGDYYSSVDAFKRRLIQDALQQTGGSKKEAARLLGMAPSYLSRLLKSLEVE